MNLKSREGNPVIRKSDEEKTGAGSNKVMFVHWINEPTF